jgi:predicted DNA-binding transcriptional regulator YafY
MVRTRFLRLIRLIECLHAGVGYSTENPARRFRVSNRTVYRDLQMLRDAGVPAFHDEDQGHRIDPNYHWKSAELRDDQWVTLLLAANTSCPKRNPHLARVIDEAIGRFLGQTPPHLQAEGARLLRSCRVKRAAADLRQTRESAGLAETIKAIRLGQPIRVHFDHVAPSAATAQTKLSGCRLVVSPDGCYVVGRSSLHRAVRRFQLGEIWEIECIGESASDGRRGFDARRGRRRNG